MATFQAQVEDLTSISVADTDELTQFLKDGVLDVTVRCLAAKPQEILNFQRESATIDSNGGLDVGGAQIISVIREAGADGSSDGSTAWRQCQQISAALQSRVVDTESLHFASKYNPKYLIDDNGKVNVYPVASSNNGYKVFFVNNVPTDETNETALIHSDSDIKWFPNEKIYLVVTYASMKLLQATMGDNIISITATVPVSPGIDILKIVAVPPIAPSIEVASVTITGTAPSYVPPTMLLRDAPTIENLVLSSAVPSPPPGPSFTTPGVSTTTVASTTIYNLGVPPTYTAPVVGGDATELSSLDDLDVDNTIDTHADQHEFDQWFATAAHLIEDEEDIELAQAQLQKISTYLQAYTGAMQSQLNIFNDANVEYQAKLQEGIQQAQIDAQKAQADAQLAATEAQQETSLLLQKEQQEYASTLQKHGADMQKYQAEVSTAVQEYQQNLAGDLQVWQAERTTDLQKYSTDIQNELNQFNRETSEYQSVLSKDTADAQFVESSEARKMQKYSAEIQVYQGLVNVEVQEFTNNFQSLMTKYQADTAAYQAKVAAETQEQSTKMQQYQLLYTQLKADYEGAFAAMYPKQQSAAPMAARR